MSTGEMREIAEQLRGVEERLRDLALDRLSAAASGDDAGLADERRLQRARRAIARAIEALEGPDALSE